MRKILDFFKREYVHEWTYFSKYKNPRTGEHYIVKSYSRAMTKWWATKRLGLFQYSCWKVDLNSKAVIRHVSQIDCKPSQSVAYTINGDYYANLSEL